MNTRLLLLLAAFALPSAAHAQAPGSPLTELFACEAITDDAQRLSCLDSAVRALRANTESGAVLAVERREVEAAEEATYGLSIPGLRLPSLRGFSLPGGSGEAAELTAADAASSTNSAAGTHIVQRDADGHIDRIENLAVEALDFTRTRRAIVTLANGQVWRQLDGDTTHVSPRSDLSDGASIRSAALDSYMMRVGTNGRWFRARRTQ